MNLAKEKSKYQKEAGKQKSHPTPPQTRPDQTSASPHPALQVKRNPKRSFHHSRNDNSSDDEQYAGDDADAVVLPRILASASAAPEAASGVKGRLCDRPHGGREAERRHAHGDDEGDEDHERAGLIGIPFVYSTRSSMSMVVLEMLPLGIFLEKRADVETRKITFCGTATTVAPGAWNRWCGALR